MDNDQAICRVCRSGPSLSQPLFHPCKCSGSIRFVHQECLIRWLSHSNKKYCELCEHPFEFTPIYRDDMPSHIPLQVLLKQCLLRLGRGLIIAARFVSVLIVWLVFLPTLTLWTWRFYFWSGENIGFTGRASSSNHSLNTQEEDDVMFLLRYNLRDFISDCVQGQIITLVVVVVFVAAYLFREWVIQNTTAPPTQAQREPEIAQNDNRTQIYARLDELRRELEQRRNNNNVNENVYNDDTLEYHNPYTANVAGQYQNTEDDDDTHPFNMNPPSGTQSPFASWRDYQQQDTGTSRLRHEIESSTDAQEPVPASGTWRASEFGEPNNNSFERVDYFSEQIVNEAILEEENDVEQEEIAIQPPDQTTNEPPRPQHENGEEAFDFVENMDGILEAIGMRGNPLILLKNLVLMALMINLCLCITVWIPYVIGRSTILIRPMSVVDKPIYVIRLVSDPIFYFVLENIISPMYNNFEYVCRYILPTSIMIAFKTLYTDAQSGIYYILKSIHITLHDNGGGSLAQLLSETTSSIIDRTNTIKNWELIKGYVYSISAIIAKRWRQCAIEHGTMDRIVCTVVGYVVLISIGSWYLTRNKITRAGSTNEILRQQGVFLKVLIFIFLELVIFPTICGVLLDISTLPLFTECSIKSRFHFVLMNPYSGVFLHWFVGTGFIFQFSVFISLVREVVRPGVLFFIRDPNDPHFHPVQDMVDQPILVLLRNLLTNAAAYFMLIMVGMGLVTLLVSKYGGIYPIIWNFGAPISSLPIDLLGIQFLLPPIMKYIVPREFSKKSVITWWHIVSRQFRLSSYMFGGRYPDEEGNFQSNKLEDDGCLVRVPTHDNVPIVVPRRRMIVPVHPITLLPLTEKERTLGHPAASQSGDESRDTTIVYIPPYFYVRLAVFLFLIWTTASILVCSVSVMPLKLGRNMFAKLNLGPDRPVHDLYSFIVGAYMMIVMSSVLNSIVQKYHKVKDDQGKIDWIAVKDYLAGRIHKIFKFLYIFIMFGFIIPFLTGILLDLYAFMPVRLSDLDVTVLDIYLTVDWAMGVAVIGLFYGSVKILPNSVPFREAVVQFSWDNFDNLDTRHITRNTIVPIISGLLGAIVVPSLLATMSIYVFAIDDPSIKILIFRCAYPILFCLICLAIIAYAATRVLNMWLRIIRDDTYLIGRQLHNLDELSS